MNHSDFQGVYKWKFLIPSIYVISWLLMIFGPIFFPYGYQIYCIIIVVYSNLKTLGIAFGTFVALIAYYRNLKAVQKKMAQYQQNNQNGNKIQKYYHAIVIPSYKEEQEVLLQTLQALSKSPRARSQFLVLLAMQAHQKGSNIKAEGLISKTRHNFFHMSYSQHKVRQGEAKGKASNVSWCVQFMHELLPKNAMISLDQIMFTVIDADSWAPKQYFQKIQIELQKRPDIKDRCMFSVGQIYTRNHLQVPVFNRIYDQMHTMAHLANMVGIHYFFPLSNYTISYNLARKIGWWDTNADAIGQDFHTCQKCYWKLQNQTFVTVPIFIPFNQLSLSTGEGYINDVKARFWQAQRHTLGVCDVAYCWNMLFKTPFRFRNLILTLLVTQVYAIAAVVPWALLALGIQYKLVSNQSIHYFPMLLIDILLNATAVFTIISYIFYEWWKRLANNRIWNMKNDAWWRVFQYPILFTVALFGFSVPSFLMASFAVLCKTTEYRVAEKRIEGAKNIQLNQIQNVQQNNQIITQPEDQRYKYKSSIQNNQDNDIVVIPIQELQGNIQINSDKNLQVKNM